MHYRPSSSFDYSEVKAFDEKDGFIRTDFGFLSGFDSEKEKAPNQVKALNGKKVAITGFMLPVDFDRGVVRSFLLLKDQTGCCFGVMPRINEFVYVKMQGGDSAEFMTDVPITVSGRFGVDEKNLVGSLYTMKADEIELTEDPFEGFGSVE